MPHVTTSLALVLTAVAVAGAPWAAAESAESAPQFTSLRGSATANSSVEESQAEQPPPHDLLHESLDTDGDGEVQLDEAAVLFARFGEQGIGEVIPETFDAEVTGVAAETEKTEAAATASNEERFAAADTDGSGGLSPEELAALTSVQKNPWIGR